MLVVILKFEEMPIAITAPDVVHFLGHIFWGLKQGLSLLLGKAGRAKISQKKGCQKKRVLVKTNVENLLN